MATIHRSIYHHCTVFHYWRTGGNQSIISQSLEEDQLALSVKQSVNRSVKQSVNRSVNRTISVSNTKFLDQLALDAQELIAYIASVIAERFTEEEKLAIDKSVDICAKELIAQNDPAVEQDLIQLGYIRCICAPINK